MGNSLAGKRDSFGKLLISSSNSLKDQLHTLMEEEEEEEEVENGEGQEADKEQTPTPSASTNHFREESSYTCSSEFLPTRPRPANLTLRTLSLRPETLPLSGTEGLPTPSLTPSPRMVGLKALMLAPSPSPSPSPLPSNPSVSSTSLRRQSLSVSPSPPPQDYIQRRQSISTFNSPAPTVIKRKSSISYKPADSGNHPLGSLPTPEPTPTSPLPPLHAALPPSSTTLVPDLDRPLSPTEQAFLFRSHTSLLCRISDLEQAIAGGRGKISSGASTGLPGMAYGRDEGYNPSKFHEQPITKISMASKPELLPTPPSDEMLQLVSDLKSERDELMRDADGWRTRVSDLEKQISTLTRRVEAERREAWVVRERLSLVEVEKKRTMEDMERGRLERRRLEKALHSEEAASTKVKEERDSLNNLLKTEQNKRKVAEREVESLRTEVERLCARAEQADADLQALLVTPKVEVTMQMPLSRRFNSIDSQISTSSNTDVEEYVPVGIRTRKLNAVQEEIEDRDLPRDVTSECGIDSDNDELAHYEDDEELDDDMMFGDDQTSSSFGSIVRSNSHLLRLDVAGAAPPPLPVHNFVPSHVHSGSMERGWSFPQSRGIPSSVPRGPPQVDNFFECLDALDAVEIDDTGILPTYDSVTAKQSWLGAVQSSDDDDDDEMPPFVLPTQPKEKNWKEIEAAKLSVLTEADDEADEEENLCKSPGFPSPHEGQATQQSEIDPVTPRARASHTFQVPTAPAKHTKARKTSTDFAIPGFKPYSGSVPILKAPPPPKRISSPQDTSTPPRPGGIGAVPLKLTSPNVMPQPTYNSQLDFTTPNKPRPSAPGPTLIPRLSTSPKPPLVKTIPPMTDMRPKSQSVATTATKLTPPKPSRSMPPVFIPQPKTTGKSVIRSSPLPPQPPMLIAQQTVSPAVSSSKQGLTFKLTQQMQSLTSLWSPWSPSSDTVGKTAGSKGDIVFEKPKVTRYVSKMRQLERLGRELREGSVLSACEYCAHCGDGVIMI